MVFTDIYPDAVKIGMTFHSELIGIIADCLRHYKARNIVLDPVMVATSGARLMEEDSIESLCNSLIPMASLITPNIPEAEVLLGGGTIAGKNDMQQSAKKIILL